MVEPEIDLHRLVWSPDDIDDGNLTTSAFPRNDLQGTGRYLSVSRIDIIAPADELSRAQGQAQNQNVEFHREQALSVVLNCGDITSSVDANGENPFAVTSKPEPSNAAHCGVENQTENRSRSYVNQLRSILVKLASAPRDLNEALVDFEKNNV